MVVKIAGAVLTVDQHQIVAGQTGHLRDSDCTC
jgi:hypothetical protein